MVKIQLCTKDTRIYCHTIGSRSRNEQVVPEAIYSAPSCEEMAKSCRIHPQRQQISAFGENVIYVT